MYEVRVVTPDQEAQAKADLLAAAALVEQRGHCKGSCQDGFGRLCATGALQVVLTGCAGMSTDLDTGKLSSRYRAALEVAKLEVRKERPDLTDVIEFNDAPTTTKADVTSLLCRAGAA